jgi:hypothetical protein
VDYEITPEPSEEERAAIAAVLAELDDVQPPLPPLEERDSP